MDEHLDFIQRVVERRWFIVFLLHALYAQPPGFS
jgi:hypothetical protein